jgi:hypothetical protein
MGLRYPIRKHVKEGMVVQMFQDGILKLNHLFPNELFKNKDDMHMLGKVENRMSS